MTSADRIQFYKTYARSKLPGGLKAAVENAAGVEDDFVCEAHLSQGTGISLTQSSLIVVQGGLLKTGLPSTQRCARFALAVVDDLLLEMETSSGNNQLFLRLRTADPEAPEWATRLYIANTNVSKAFHLAKNFWLVTSVKRSAGRNLPINALHCPHCHSPLVEYDVV